MAGFVSELFPGVLQLQKQDSFVPTTTLAGADVIALYFSASWCGPCRSFTPVLINAYNALKKEGKNFEVIFISSDSDAEEFDSYYSKMPWLALPYDDYRDLAEDIGERYGCNGIPHLVMIDGKTGKEMTRDGRKFIVDYGAEAFPWDDQSIEAVTQTKNNKICDAFKNWKMFTTELSTPLLASSADAVAVFIASPEGPAQQHICPRLLHAYETLGPRLAVIFLSFGGEDDADWGDFLDSLPKEWHVMRTDTNAALSAISDALSTPVNRLDALIMFNRDASVLINADASRMVHQFSSLGFPWPTHFVEDYKKNNFESPGLKFLADARLVCKDAEGGVTPVKCVSAPEHLKDNDLVGLYFSSHWCPPCRAFTPVFGEIYSQLKASGKKVEVVFISSDRDHQSFEHYYTTDMPWLALDFAQRELKGLISSSLGVSGIPTLVWINPKTGELFMEGREMVTMGVEYFPWTADMKVKKVEAESAHAREIEESFRSAGTVVVKNHKGVGTIGKDYTLTFSNFNSFLADVQLPSKGGGSYYYEVEMVSVESVAQFGWATDRFKKCDHTDGNGVGDDTFSWGFDGFRYALFGSNQVSNYTGGDDTEAAGWKEGDIVGLAADLNAKTLSMSVNGVWFEGFRGIALPSEGWVAPALSASGGTYRVNFGDRPFAFAPPRGERGDYVSVHAAKGK